MIDFTNSNWPECMQYQVLTKNCHDTNIFFSTSLIIIIVFLIIYFYNKRKKED